MNKQRIIESCSVQQKMIIKTNMVFIIIYFYYCTLATQFFYRNQINHFCLFSTIFSYVGKVKANYYYLYKNGANLNK